MGSSQDTGREQRLLEQANGHFGLLHYEDLKQEGLTPRAIRARVDACRLTHLHHCVYVFGHSALRDEGRWLAALWACGRGSALSHLTAGAYYRWPVTEPVDGDVHVTTTRSVKSRDGIVVHRSRLERRDVFWPKHFVVTSMPRTLVDLADVLSWPQYRALADGLPDLPIDGIRAAQRRAPFRVGSPRVRRLIEADDAHTKSEFERRYLRFSRRHGIPRPNGLNEVVAGHKADCVYGDARLVVELDGRAFHRRRVQMRADRQRDSDYQLAGFRILRLVWDDLHLDEARATAHRVRRMLGASGR